MSSAKSTIAAITDFIFLETPVSTADVILVPGGHPRQLMERAAELYHKGLAPLILPSGGENPLLPGTTEWEFLRNTGVSLGIPPRVFLKEDRARHTFDNATLSWRALAEAGIEVNAAILVCKAFHARRASMTYHALSPRLVDIMVSPIHDERNIRRDNWFLSDVGTQRVMSELQKIGKYFGPHMGKLSVAG